MALEGKSVSMTWPLCISFQEFYKSAFIFSKANRDIIQCKLQLNVLHISVVNHIFVQNDVSITFITLVPCTVQSMLMGGI